MQERGGGGGGVVRLQDTKLLRTFSKHLFGVMDDQNL